MSEEEKIRENRLRRAASRQNLRLEKSKARDSRAVDYGTYRLVSIDDGTPYAHGYHGYGLALDDIENVLNRIGHPSIWKRSPTADVWEGPESRLNDVGFHLSAEYDEENGIHFYGNMERESEQYSLMELRSIHRAIGRILDKVDAAPTPTRRSSPL